jgi:hypothetical protein
MLQSIAPDLWHLQHEFAVTGGIRISSRMTVIRLADSTLWLHSPVPLSADVRAQIAALGEVRYIVAPNKLHHLFVADCAAAFPGAAIYGARGLKKKRPDLASLRELTREVETQWSQDFEQTFFDGIPIGNETVWFHKRSRTLIVTDLLQCWRGELQFAAKLYASLTGVNNRLAVPRTIRLAVKDRAAARASAKQILCYPFERVITAHNSIVEDDAYAAVERAFDCFR